MTIKKTVFDFTSKILSSEYRKIIKKTIKEIEDENIEVEIGDKLPKTKFGKIIRNQSARTANIQFYGYLLAHQCKNAIEKDFDCIVPNLTENQISNLQDVHNEILYLNYKCIENLPKQLKHHHAINPYFEFNGHLLKNNYSPIVFNHEEVQQLKSMFKQHAGFKLIERIDVSDFDKLNEIRIDRLVSGIISFEKSITNAGVKRSPRDLEDAFRKHLKSGAKTPISYMISLLSIKESLKNMNQLIYQAFIHDKLLSLDNGNIINFCSSSHYVGTSFVVEAQFNFFSEPAQIVILKEPSQNNSELCRIEKSTFSFSKEVGSQNILHLRKLDSDLNPFHNLLKETLQDIKA